jgi:hypothetical protein
MKFINVVCVIEYIFGTFDFEHPKKVTVSQRILKNVKAWINSAG